MPIKHLEAGLFDRPPRTIGKLRSGGPQQNTKMKIGHDLDHFRFTSDLPGAQLAMHNAFKDTVPPESLKRKGKMIYKSPNDGAACNHIPVFLPFPTIDQNFGRWMECYDRNRLLCRHDGEFVHQYYDERYKGYVFPEAGTMEVPDKWRGKEVGRLLVVIPALWENGFFGDLVTVETHSKHSIMRLLQQMYQIYRENQQFGGLQGVALILYRYPAEITTPEHGRQVKHLIGLRKDPAFAMAQLTRMKEAARITAQFSTGYLPAGMVIEGGGDFMPSVPELPRQISAAPVPDAVPEVDPDVDTDTGEIVTPAEIATADDPPPAKTTKPKATGKSRTGKRPLTKKQKKIHAMLSQLYGKRADEIRPRFFEQFGVKSSNDPKLTDKDYDKVIRQLQRRKDDILNGDRSKLEMHIAKMMGVDRDHAMLWVEAVAGDDPIEDVWALIKAFSSVTFLTEGDTDVVAAHNTNALDEIMGTYAVS